MITAHSSARFQSIVKTFWIYINHRSAPIRYFKSPDGPEHTRISTHEFAQSTWTQNIMGYKRPHHQRWTRIQRKKTIDEDTFFFCFLLRILRIRTYLWSPRRCLTYAGARASSEKQKPERIFTFRRIVLLGPCALFNSDALGYPSKESRTAFVLGCCRKCDTD